MLHWSDWSLVTPDEWPWRYFTPEEMACKGTRSLKTNPQFMDRLEELRTRVGFALPVSSGYRSPEYDHVKGGAGVHPSGCAADILIAGASTWTLLSHATRLGFHGIGVSQKGRWKHRFIHLDTLVSDQHPRPRVWSYG